MDYKYIVKAISDVWAIMPEKLEAILGFLALRIENGALSKEEIEARIGAKRATKFKNIKGNIAVLPLYGTIAQKMNLMSDYSGGTSTELFGKWLDEAVGDKSIGAIVIDVDSPGGSVYGVQELSDKIYSARGTKPVIAMVNSLSASAAYWISSAADEIVVTPGGEVGSIGVVAVHTDYSAYEEKQGLKTTLIHAGKYKVEGNPYESLDDEARTEIQKRVDEYYSEFVSSVARNRGVTSTVVNKDFGQGRVFGAKESIKGGLADRIGTLEEVIQDLGANQNKNYRAKSQRLLALHKAR